MNEKEFETLKKEFEDIQKVYLDKLIKYESAKKQIEMMSDYDLVNKFIKVEDNYMYVTDMFEGDGSLLHVNDICLRGVVFKYRYSQYVDNVGNYFIYDAENNLYISKTKLKYIDIISYEEYMKTLRNAIDKIAENAKINIKEK